MHLRAYLSSTKKLDEPFTEWKQELIDQVNANEFFRAGEAVITWIDPLKFKSWSPMVVEADLGNVELADAMFICMNEPTIGTMMELMYSLLKRPGQLRYLITSRPSITAHPWIKNLILDKPYGNLGRVTLCTSIPEAVSAFVQDIENAKDETERF